MAQVRRLTRSEAEAAFDDLARLRIEVFRAYPYLYDGDIDYERRYLSTFMAGEGAVVSAAFEDGRIVGAATASPLAQHFEDFSAPFAARGLPVADFFYFGESVLLPHWRGQGIGVRFFAEREAAASEGGFAACTFCAVVRPADHPLRPPGYVPLDDFWRRRGYRPVDGLTTRFSWRDTGEEAESEKTMQFWMRRLA